MYTSEVFINKCCFIIPLQSGLQIWAFLKALADIGVTTFIIQRVIIMTTRYGFEFTFEQFTLVHSFILVAVVLLLDCLFMVVLCIGLGKSNLGWLRAFFYYTMFMAGTCSSVLMGVSVYRAMHLMTFDLQTVYTIAAICASINIPLDVYIITILLSKMKKIQIKQRAELELIIPNTDKKMIDDRITLLILDNLRSFTGKFKGKGMISKFGDLEPLKKKAISDLII